MAGEEMSYGLPDDWYIEPTGESRILDQEKVAAEIACLRSAVLTSRFEMRWNEIANAPQDMRPILAYSPGNWETPPEWAVVFRKRDGWVYQTDDHLYMSGITHFALLTEPSAVE